MAEPQPVTVVRPRPTFLDAGIALVVAAGNVLTSAFIVMVVAGHFELSRYGYADAVLLVIAVRSVLPSRYYGWTQSWPRAVGRRG